MNTLPTAETLAAFALRGAWESALLAGFAAALFRFLPGLSPRARTALAGTIFALAVLLPSLAPGAPSTAQAGPSGLPILALPVYAGTVVCGLWAALSTALLVRIAIGAGSLLRLLHAAEPAPLALDSMYRGLVAGRAGRARLLVTANLPAPSACGLLRPTILLPRGLVQTLPPEELAAILRHEAAHLDAGDDWLTLALALTRAAFPFALGLGPLERRILLVREAACDRAALATGLSRKRYAACLAGLAESALRQRGALAPGLGGSARSGLAARVEAILAAAPAQRGPGMLRSVAAAAMGSALALGLPAAPSPVAFTPQAAPPEFAAAPAPVPLPAAAPLRPASLVLPGSARTAPVHASSARKHRAASRKRILPAQPAFTQVVWTQRIVFLVPVAQAPVWTRIVFLTL